MERTRRRNKKSESRVVEILLNSRMLVECTAQTEFKITAKRQREMDTYIFSDGQMPAKRTVLPTSKAPDKVLEREDKRDLPKHLGHEDGINLELGGPFGNERDREAGDTDWTAKIAWISNQASDLTANLQKSTVPFPGAQHLQSGAVPDAVPQQDPDSGNKPSRGPVMTESAVFGQNTESVAASDAPIGCPKKTQTFISHPSLMTSGNCSRDKVCTTAVIQNTLEEWPKDNHELQTFLSARRNVGLGEAVGNDVEDLTNTNTNPDARIQELEDCVAAQALKLVSQAKEIKSLVETVSELRARIQERPGR
ncbi:hypothetical protein BDW71DRAFT_196347 [Aspergillus fruticulosus]